MENYGFLLLCSHLGNPDRKPLTTAQLRLLARRVMDCGPFSEGELTEKTLLELGFSPEGARHILALLEDQALLEELNLTDLAKRVGEKPLGDFGDNISGGERQRICIARAMQKHASVMVFDEPTTGLDPENVKLIQEFIFRQKHITRIVITHDWSEDYLDRFDEVIRIPGAAD